MTGGIVLDPGNPRHVEMVARVQWDRACVTGRAFGDLPQALQYRLCGDARKFLEKLAQQPDAMPAGGSRPGKAA